MVDMVDIPVPFRRVRHGASDGSEAALALRVKRGVGEEHGVGLPVVLIDDDAHAVLRPNTRAGARRKELAELLEGHAVELRGGVGHVGSPVLI